MTENTLYLIVNVKGFGSMLSADNDNKKHFKTWKKRQRERERKISHPTTRLQTQWQYFNCPWWVWI